MLPIAATTFLSDPGSAKAVSPATAPAGAACAGDHRPVSTFRFRIVNVAPPGPMVSSATRTPAMYKSYSPLGRGAGAAGQPGAKRAAVKTRAIMAIPEV